MKDLDAVLAERPFVRNNELTRTVDALSLGLASGDELRKIIGRARVEDGYLSTTRFADGGATKGYRGAVRLTVVAPAGTHAAAIEDVSRVPGQGEVLLARGLKYVITAAAYDARIGMWRATMTIWTG